jgi:hypothetical protein
MRHTGLTFVGSGGASLAELMRPGGHSSVTAALKYQHATDGRDRGVAEGLAMLAQTLEVPDEKKMRHAGARTPNPRSRSRSDPKCPSLAQAAEAIHSTSVNSRIRIMYSSALFKTVNLPSC